MKKFNQTISIEVEVDEIAAKLLNQMNPEFAHREIVVEAIVGNLINSTKQGMTQLFNALNGFTNEIDFKVGDIVTCTEGANIYVPINEADGEWDTNYQPIGVCQIIDIDVYRKDKVLVEFFNGKSNREIWVNHKTLNLPVEEKEPKLD